MASVITDLNYDTLKAKFRSDIGLDAKGNEAIFLSYVQTYLSHMQNGLLSEIHNRISEWKAAWQGRR